MTATEWMRLLKISRRWLDADDQRFCDLVSTVPNLGHHWIYAGGRHFDSREKAGVEQPLHLPYFRAMWQWLEEQRERGSPDFMA